MTILLGLIHCQICARDNVILVHFVIDEHHHANAGCAVVFNSGFRFALSLERQHIGFGQSGAYLFGDDAGSRDLLGFVGIQLA